MNRKATGGTRLRHAVSRLAPYATMPVIGVYSGYSSFLRNDSAWPTSRSDWADIAVSLVSVAFAIGLCVYGRGKLHGLRQEPRAVRVVMAALTSRWCILLLLFTGLTFCLLSVADAQWMLLLHRNGLPAITGTAALFILRIHGKTRTYEDIDLARTRTT